MDKAYASPEAALADLHDGASIAVAGFGTSYGFACSLLVAARDKGVKNLTLVSNGLGAVGQLRGMLLVASGQVSKLIVSFSSRPGVRTPADDLIESGEIEVELVPQGTLVERMRAAGAGIRPSTRRPASARRSPKARRCATSTASRTSWSRRCPSTTRSCAPTAPIGWATSSCAAAAATSSRPLPRRRSIAIVEVDEIVEVGRDPGRAGRAARHPRRAGSSRRRSSPTRRAWRRGAPRTSRASTTASRAGRGSEMARADRRRCCAEGSYVNLGIGHPDAGLELHRRSRHHPARRERHPRLRRAWSSGDDIDHDIFNASGQYVALAARRVVLRQRGVVRDGARRASSTRSCWARTRSTRRATSPTYSLGDARLGGIGGAMDLVAGEADADRDDGASRQPGPRQSWCAQSAYPLTGVSCVDVVVTDLAILRRINGEFVIEEVADGFSRRRGPGADRHGRSAAGLERPLSPAMAAVWGVRANLDLDNLDYHDGRGDRRVPDRSRKGRGPLDPGPQYDMRANSVWLYTRPDVAKLHMRVLDGWHSSGIEPIITASSFANMHTYINQGVEIGIENCTRGLQQRGVTQSAADGSRSCTRSSAPGMRGLEWSSARSASSSATRSTDPSSRSGPTGWAPDMAAFYCGLDPSTKDADRPATTRPSRTGTSGPSARVPRWVTFLAKHEPADAQGVAGASGRACSAARCRSR